MELDQRNPVENQEEREMSPQALDLVGEWTEIKLQIIRDYASAYSKIMVRQPAIREFGYIDGFAGSGTHISRAKGDEISGSPVIALDITPPFGSYHFIDLDGTKTARLRSLAKGRDNVWIYEEDCNKVLLEKVFPRFQYSSFRRALCLLDPYDLNPHWQVTKTAANLGTIDIFLNFMIFDANRNVFLWNYENANPAQIERMNLFWGDANWKSVAYTSVKGLFGDVLDKAPNKVIAKAFQNRLHDIAGFKHVPDPVPLRNSKGAVIYYLFFASHNETGAKIARSIFNKYRKKGIIYGG